MLPTLAAVIDHKAPVYARIPLVEHYPDSSPAYSLEPDAIQPGRTFGMLQVLSQLFSLNRRFKVMALFRGFGIFALLSAFEGIVAVSSFTLFHPLLAILPQILLPLMLVQIYTLWTHTVLTHPSTKSFRERIPPFTVTLRAVGPALAAFLASKALTRFAVLQLRTSKTNRFRGDLDPHYIALQVLTAVAVELLAVAPAHLLLTRVQASLLPADERPIAPIDEALRPDGKKDGWEAVGVREALTTFGWRTWLRLALLYAQVGFLVLLVGGLLFVLEFYIFLFVALSSYQF
jgi:hypothetical protein